MDRRIPLAFLALCLLVLHRADSQEEAEHSGRLPVAVEARPVRPQDSGPAIVVAPVSVTLGRPSDPGQVLHRWIEPLPHVSGVDDVELHSLGLIVPDSIQRYWRTHSPRLNFSASTVVTSMDWSAFDSPVKAQGHCGSCWAFAAVAAVENAGVQDDLSEQVLISCSNAGSCSGGYYEGALQYILAAGLPGESAYLYTETKGNCAARQPRPEFIERLKSVTTTMWGDRARLNDLKAALMNGPVIVTMVVYSDFDAYRGGIYHHTSGAFRGYHAVLVVGYNDDLRCFKAKNSWGRSWGEGGYFRISYEDLSNSVKFGGYGAQVSGAYTEYLRTAFEIANSGSEELVMTSLRCDRPWLALDPADSRFTLAPHASRSIALTVHWDQVPEGEDLGTITILSNDRDNSRLAVTVRALKGEVSSRTHSVSSGRKTREGLRNDQAGLEHVIPSTAAERARMESGTEPLHFSLEQNYPNPFNPKTAIKYTIAGTRELGFGASKTRLVVYDLSGREVAVLADEEKRPGRYEVNFDGGGLPSGVYFYRLSAGSEANVKRMVLVR